MRVFVGTAILFALTLAVTASGQAGNGPQDVPAQGDGTGGSPGNWGEWRVQQRITINLGDATPGEEIEGFPFLVRLDENSCPNLDFLNDRNSVRFMERGQELDFEIESWDPSTRTASIWVKLDFRDGEAEKTIIMLWGNDDVASASDGAAVFGSASGFRGVWHLEEVATTTFADASSNARNGTSHVRSTGKLGVIGKGQQFTKAASDYIEVAEPQDRQVTQFTLSAWVRQDKLYRDWDDTDDEERQQWIVGNRKWGGPASGYEMLSLGTQICASIRLENENKWFYRQRAFSKTKRWYHAAVTWSAETGKLTFYIDGAVHDEPVDFNVSQFTCHAGAPFRISTPKKDGSNSGYNGHIDEVREETRARSADWIALCYANQKPGSDMLTFGEVRIDGFLPLAGGKMLGDIDIGGHRVKSTDGDDMSYIDFVGNEGNTGRAIRLHADDGSASTEMNVVPGDGVVIDGEIKADAMNIKRMSGDLDVGTRKIVSSADGYYDSYVRFHAKDGPRKGALELYAEASVDKQGNEEGTGTYESAAVLLIPNYGMIVRGADVCMLDVRGTVKAQAIKINDWTLEQRTGDFVFDSSYALPSLEDMEAYVKKERHLPEMPSAKQIGKEGLDLVEMNLVLLKRVEELLLHTIDQGKKIDTLNKKSAEQQTQIEALEGALNRE